MCNVCLIMDRKERMMQPKGDTLKKHEGRKKVLVNMPKCKVKKGERYMSQNPKLMKNLSLFNARSLEILLQHMNQSKRLKTYKKKMHFATLSQVLSYGRPMLEYENQAALHWFLNVPTFPRMHWLDNYGWLMVEFIYDQIEIAI